MEKTLLDAIRKLQRAQTKSRITLTDGSIQSGYVSIRQEEHIVKIAIRHSFDSMGYTVYRLPSIAGIRSHDGRISWENIDGPRAVQLWHYRYASTMLSFYKRAAQFLKDHPQGLIQLDWATELSAGEYRANFVKALHERINAKSEVPHNWRKLDTNYQRGLLSDARTMREYHAGAPRLSGRNLLNTPELKKRYPAINSYRAD